MRVNCALVSGVGIKRGDAGGQRCDKTYVPSSSRFVCPMRRPRVNAVLGALLPSTSVGPRAPPSV